MAVANGVNLTCPSRLPLAAAPVGCMTERDQQRIAGWIRDAFAILCTRVGRISEAEAHLRLGFEAILRQLGTSPLRMVPTTVPLAARTATSAGDLRQIMKALDSCLAVYQRYDAVLTTVQRRIQILARATRRYAAEELEARQRVATGAPVMAVAAAAVPA